MTWQQIIVLVILAWQTVPALWMVNTDSDYAGKEFQWTLYFLSIVTLEFMALLTGGFFR